MARCATQDILLPLGERTLNESLCNACFPHTSKSNIRSQVNRASGLFTKCFCLITRHTCRTVLPPQAIQKHNLSPFFVTRGQAGFQPRTWWDGECSSKGGHTRGKVTPNRTLVDLRVSRPISARTATLRAAANQKKKAQLY